MKPCRYKVYFTIYLITVAYTAGSQIINIDQYTKTNYYIITGQTQLLKTLTPLTIDSAQALSNAFQVSDNKPVIFNDYDPYYYWFRFVIKNNTDAPRPLMLIMGPIGMYKGLLYQKQDSQWKEVAHSGLAYPFKDRSYQSANYIFPFSLPAQTVDTLYLSIDATGAFKSFGFGLMEPPVLKAFENKVYFEFGIIVGLLLLFCIFNIYLFFALRESLHIWYALYIVMLLLILMKNDQLDQQFFGWDNKIANKLTSLMGFGAIAIGILIHVIQKFLSNIQKTHALYKIATVVKINAIVSGISHIIAFITQPGYRLQNIIFNWADNSTILGILVIIIACIYSLTKGFKSASFILIGLLVFLIGATQRLLLIGTSTYLFPPSVFHIGMVLETLIISSGLVYQYRLDRKEKYLYLKEKETLKMNYDKLLVESKFEIQEQTLKNVSQEIHDNIGQILSVIKINLFNITKRHAIMEESLKDTSGLISKAITDLRHLSKKMDTDYIKEMGIVELISAELKQIEKMCGHTTSLLVYGEIYPIESQKALILFRIYQEILNNIIKHANADAIKVQLQFLPTCFELSVTDNGIGFDINKLNNHKGTNGLGLKNMQTRAALLGAEFIIDSINGTSITIKLPAVA